MDQNSSQYLAEEFDVKKNLRVRAAWRKISTRIVRHIFVAQTETLKSKLF